MWWPEQVRREENAASVYGTLLQYEQAVSPAAAVTASAAAAPLRFTEPRAHHPSRRRRGCCCYGFLSRWARRCCPKPAAGARGDGGSGGRELEVDAAG